MDWDTFNERAAERRILRTTRTMRILNATVTVLGVLLFMAVVFLLTWGVMT